MRGGLLLRISRPCPCSARLSPHPHRPGASARSKSGPWPRLRCAELRARRWGEHWQAGCPSPPGPRAALLRAAGATRPHVELPAAALALGVPQAPRVARGCWEQKRHRRWVQTSSQACMTVCWAFCCEQKKLRTFKEYSQPLYWLREIVIKYSS